VRDEKVSVVGGRGIKVSALVGVLAAVQRGELAKMDEGEEGLPASSSRRKTGVEVRLVLGRSQLLPLLVASCSFLLDLQLTVPFMSSRPSLWSAVVRGTRSADASSSKSPSSSAPTTVEKMRQHLNSAVNRIEELKKQEDSVRKHQKIAETAHVRFLLSFCCPFCHYSRLWYRQSALGQLLDEVRRLNVDVNHLSAEIVRFFPAIFVFPS
jgi:hypothetical protein